MILRPAIYDLWLDPGFRDLEPMTEMLKPYDGRAAQPKLSTVDQLRGAGTQTPPEVSKAPPVSGYGRLRIAIAGGKSPCAEWFSAPQLQRHAIAGISFLISKTGTIVHPSRLFATS